jgi:branched-chain amino acid transport system permease protein
MQFLVAIVAVALLVAIWYTDRNERVNRRVPIALQIVLVVWVAIAPFWFGAADQFVDVSTQALAYVVMALGLNIVVGFAGLLDLGYVAFFAFGAYTIGWFSSSFIVKGHIHLGSAATLSALPGVHLNFLLIVVIAMVICAIAGVLIGLPTLRLRGDYIAIVTLGFGEIIRVFATNGDSIKIFGQQLTAGRQGITPVDPVKLPFTGQFDQLHLRPWYWTALVMVLIALFVNVRLRDSRLGRAWIAVREDEVAAASMGVPLVRTKLLSYATGAAFGGMAGAFLGAYLSTVNADQFAFSFSILILAMVILGGLGSIWGVVLGALALAYLNTYLIPNVFRDLPHKIGFNFDLTDVSFGIFGFVLVLMMLLRPEGLLPERRRQLEMEEGVGTGADIYEVSA